MAGITAIKRTGYLHGGVTHPDGRRGFFAGAERDSREKGTSMSPGTDAQGNQRDQSDSGQRDDMSIRDFNPNLNTGPDRFELAAINAEEKKQRDAQKAFEERLKKEKEEAQRKKALGTTGPLKINYKTSYFNNIKNKTIQKALDRNKLLAMKKLNLTKTFNPFAKVPDWAKDYTEEDLMQIATSGPYLGQQKTKADVSKFAEGKDLLSRVFEGQSILNTDNFPQSEYERLFPSNLNFGGGGGDDPIIYTNTGNTDDTTDDDTTDDTTDDYRFGDNLYGAADVTRGSYIFNQGGRVPRAFGGIMDTATGRKAYGFGSIFKSVGKAIGKVGKAAGKVLKSDIGKAAIAGAMFYYGGGGGMPKFLGGSGLGGFKASTFFSKANPLLFSANEAGKQVFNPFKASGLLTLGGALMGPAKQDQMPGDGNRGGSLIDPLTGKEAKPAEMRASLNEALDSADGDPDKIKAIQDAYAFLGPDQRLGTYLPYETYGVKDGGRIRAQEGGLMNLGGMEKDYRAEGGFVPIGKQEKADDVPARLSVNEFVFTADAVRNAGGGDIDRGAEVMENMMKNLENGGTVSEESQGNTGAQEMFSVSERIGEVI